MDEDRITDQLNMLRRDFIKLAGSAGAFSVYVSGGVASFVPSADAGQTAGFILQPDEGEVLWLGNPPGKVIIKVDPAKTGSPQMAMGIQYVERAIPIHLHEQEEEFLFVHRGQGVGILGDARVAVQAGATIYIPPGTWHGVENTGDEASQIMWVVTPGAGKATQLEHFFREAGSPPGTDPKSFTMERLVDMLEKHGMKVKPQ